MRVIGSQVLIIIEGKKYQFPLVVIRPIMGSQAKAEYGKNKKFGQDLRSSMEIIGSQVAKFEKKLLISFVKENQSRLPMRVNWVPSSNIFYILF